MNVIIGPTIRLPTKHGQFDVQHVAVSQPGGGLYKEGVVLQNPTSAIPIAVRVQSSCLFSESFWATDCDCALQLQSSLVRIAEQGGTLLYFYEEGRGAGLEAKFKAIELQQVRGMNTQQAYECLKMSIDTRSYEAAAAVLKKLHDGSPINLLSNNPAKADGLSRNGVNVVARTRLVCGWEQAPVRQYLLEKKKVLGHDIPEKY